MKLRFPGMQNLIALSGVLVSGAAGVLVAFVGLRALRALATTMARIDLGTAPSFPRLGPLSPFPYLGS